MSVLILFSANLVSMTALSRRNAEKRSSCVFCSHLGAGKDVIIQNTKIEVTSPLSAIV